MLAGARYRGERGRDAHHLIRHGTRTAEPRGGARAARLGNHVVEQGIGAMRLSYVPAPCAHPSHLGVCNNSTELYRLTAGISGRLGLILSNNKFLIMFQSSEVTMLHRY